MNPSGSFIRVSDRASMWNGEVEQDFAPDDRSHAARFARLEARVAELEARLPRLLISAPVKEDEDGRSTES